MAFGNKNTWRGNFGFKNKEVVKNCLAFTFNRSIF
jgi:hypothetical protein